MRIRRPADLGAVARQQRLDLGLSQDGLAAEAGVSRQWLIRFEQGGSDVSVTKAFAVLDALDLVTTVEPRTPPETTAAPRIRVDATEGLSRRWTDLARQLRDIDAAELRRRADTDRRATDEQRS